MRPFSRSAPGQESRIVACDDPRIRARGKGAPDAWLADQKRHALTFAVLGGGCLFGAYALLVASGAWYSWLAAGLLAWVALSSWFLVACILTARRPEKKNVTER